METFLAVANLIVSSFIVIGVAVNWGRYHELNFLERTGYSAMAMFCAAIVIKGVYYLSLQEFRSDMFGILFRGAYLAYLIGNTYRNFRKPLSDIWMRQDRAFTMAEEAHC